MAKRQAVRARPEAWPVNGIPGHQELADWLNYGGEGFIGVQGYRLKRNPDPSFWTDANAAEAGLPFVTVATSYEDAQRGGTVHPMGIDMHGLHEYQGESVAVAFERNRLTTLALPFAFRFVYEVTKYGAEPEKPAGYEQWKAANADYLARYAEKLGGVVAIEPGAPEVPPVALPGSSLPAGAGYYATMPQAPVDPVVQPAPVPTPIVSGELPPGAGFYAYIGENPPTTVTSPAPMQSAFSANLLEGRYKVEANFGVESSTPGFLDWRAAHIVPLTADSAVAWFFSDNNLEMLIKVVGDVNKPWIFAGGCTNVGVILMVTDTQTGEVAQYVNPFGTPFQPIQDTNAFGRS